MGNTVNDTPERQILPGKHAIRLSIQNASLSVQPFLHCSRQRVPIVPVMNIKTLELNVVWTFDCIVIVNRYLKNINLYFYSYICRLWYYWSFRGLVSSVKFLLTVRKLGTRRHGKVHDTRYWYLSFTSLDRSVCHENAINLLNSLYVFNLWIINLPLADTISRSVGLKPRLHSRNSIKTELNWIDLLQPSASVRGPVRDYTVNCAFRSKM